MSKYTTEVRFICESQTGHGESQDGTKVEEIIREAIPKIFDFDFPIFDDAYRDVLCAKILRHFYTREIGFETYGLWKLKLNTRLNEIMPYYNKMYESELLEFNPMYDVNYTRSGSESLSTSESMSSSLSSSESQRMSNSASYENSMLPQSHEWVLEQDTPQNGLSDVESMAYLSRATKTARGGHDRNVGESNDNGQSSRSATTTDTSLKEGYDTKGYLESIVGYRSNNPSKLLSDYRDTFLNIDMMIIRDLEPLFMQLW